MHCGVEANVLTRVVASGAWLGCLALCYNRFPVVFSETQDTGDTWGSILVCTSGLTIPQAPWDLDYTINMLNIYLIK